MYNQLLPVVFRDFDYFSNFSGLFTKDQLMSLPTSLEFGQGKNITFYFTESFRCVPLNKSVLETKETKQTRLHLYFAPKIIKIRLVAFENELVEDDMLVPKKSQN